MCGHAKPRPAQAGHLIIQTQERSHRVTRGQGGLKRVSAEVRVGSTILREALTPQDAVWLAQTIPVLSFRVQSFPAILSQDLAHHWSDFLWPFTCEWPCQWLFLFHPHLRNGQEELSTLFSFPKGTSRELSRDSASRFVFPILYSSFVCPSSSPDLETLTCHKKRRTLK